MKWKNRLTNYNFWVSIVSAVLLILQNFDVQFDLANFNDILTAVLGLLVVIGIINDPTKSNANTTNENAKDNTNNKFTEQDKQPEASEGVVNNKVCENENTSSTTATENLKEDENESENAVEQDVDNNLQVENTQINTIPIVAKDEDNINNIENTEKVFVENENEINNNLIIKVDNETDNYFQAETEFDNNAEENLNNTTIAESLPENNFNENNSTPNTTFNIVN